MRQIGLIGVFLVMAFVSFGQGKWDANWCFGSNAALSFDSNGNVSTFPIVVHSEESVGSISDSNGNLLYYFDNPQGEYFPYQIKDATGNVIVNGDSLNIDASVTNGILILPISNHKHYIFTLNGYYTNLECPYYDCRHLEYSIVEDSNSVLKVSLKNRPLMSTPVEERMAAVKHANGKDWWIIVHASQDSQPTNRFIKFLLHNDSIQGPFFQDIGMNSTSYLGEMIFSKQGNYLAIALGNQNEGEVFNFDRCTGELSKYISLPNVGLGGLLYSCEFSKNESRLYFVESYEGAGKNEIFQYTLGSNIQGSKQLIWSDSLINYEAGQLQIAPDNKIYWGTLRGRDHYLGVINQPDSLGSICDLQLHSLYMGDSSKVITGLPNFPNYNLTALPIYIAKAGKDTTWCSDSTQGVILGSPAVANIVYHWQPGKGLSDSTIAQPMARPDSSTYYILTVTDTSQNATSCTTRSDTVLVSVQKCDTTGIVENTTAPKIRVLPNPANNKLVVESPLRNKGAIFKMYDVAGHCVLQKPIEDLKTVIDISALPAGLYIYRMKEQSGKVQVVR